MNIHEAAKILGGTVSSDNTISCPGPGHSRADRSLSVMFIANDIVVWSHSGDDWQACKTFVRMQLDMAGMGQWPAALRVERYHGDTDGKTRALTLWHEAGPIAGTPADAYLTSRGIGGYWGDALRWHPSCPYGKRTRHGCMIALIRNMVTGEPQAVQRTALKPDGEKIGRMTLGPSRGGVIKLTGEAGPVMGIAEGVESALSLRRLADMATVPVWSLVNADGLSAFPVIEGVQTLWIAADHDDAGIAAARHAAETWFNARREVYLAHSSVAGEDLNDIVKGLRNG